MIIEGAAPAMPGQAKRVMRTSGIVSLISVLTMVAVLSIDVKYQMPVLVWASQIASVVALLGAACAAGSGLWHLRRARPDLRRPVLIILAMTLAVLTAHLYIVDSPPTFTGGTLEGPVGADSSDSHIALNSSVAGSLLSVTVRNVGDLAIGNMSLYLDGRSLPVSGISTLPSPTKPLQPAGTSPLGFPTVARGTWVATLTNASELKVDYQLLTCYRTPTLSDPKGVYGCVMDEVYYVSSAQGIIAGTQCAPYADSCNLEHPPLAKALMAAGMAVFGVGDMGFRFSNIVLGTLSIPLVFVLVYLMTGNRRLGYFSAALMALDTMFFVHASIGVIDVPVVFFSLLGFILYFRHDNFWKFDNYIASGVMFGLAALSKETAVFSLAAVLSYDLVLGNGGLRSLLSRTSRVTATALAVFLGGVQLFDALFTSESVPWFYQHVGFMLSYGSSLTANVLACSPVTGYWCKFPNLPGGPPILPTDWLLFYTPVAYLVTTVAVTVAGSASYSYVSVGYYGFANPVIVWMFIAWVPLVVYKWVKSRREEAALSVEDRFGALLLIWLVWTYFPYIVLFIYSRVTYPFYLIPALPALAMGAGYAITRGPFPTGWVRCTSLARSPCSCSTSLSKTSFPNISGSCWAASAGICAFLDRTATLISTDLQTSRGIGMSRVADVKTRISSVELLATLKKRYSYRELSAVLGLSAPILSRYVRGHVLPSSARSEKFIATFREKLLRKMILDEVRVTRDGSYDLSAVVSNVGLLGQIAKVVYSEFGLVPVDKVVTMEVDGVPLAVEVAGEFNVNLAVARAERDLGVEDFLEQKVVYSPSSVKYLYLPRSAIKRGEHVLIVDDMVRSGTTIEALSRIAEKAKAKIVGVFAIASVDQSMPKLKSRLGLTCPIESLVTLEQKSRHYNF